MTVHIEIPDCDCPACRKTRRVVQALVRQKAIQANLAKVPDPARIAAFGVLPLPDVAVEGRLVHQGGVPSRETIARWLDR